MNMVNFAHQNQHQPMTVSSNQRSAFAVITALFFMWGFITCLNDILIPHLKKAFDLQYWQAMLVQFAFFGAYFVVSLLYYIYSFASGDPIARAGYQKGLVAGLVLSGIGCALFFPAAGVHSYALFLLALFVLASGITIIQIAANPYVAILGPSETASGRLNLAQGLNSLGYVIAPVIGGAVIFGSTLQGAESVKMPYVALAGAFFVLALIFSFIRLPKVNAGEQMVRENVLVKYPGFAFGMLAIFCYVGAEVAVGSVLVNYLGLKEVMGYDHETANKFLSFYWGGLMIGRFMGAISLGNMKSNTNKALLMAVAAVAGTLVIFAASSRDWFTGVQKLQFSEITLFLIMVALSYGAFFLGRSKPGRMVGIFSLVIIGLLLLTMGSHGDTAMWTIIGIGLFNSVMWSNIFTLSIEKLGKDTSQGSSLLVMMIVGGALLPPLQGLVADYVTGLKFSLVVPLVAYFYLVWYGFRGWKV